MQDKLTPNAMRGKPGYEMMKQARKWIARNPRAWGYIESEAIKAADEGRRTSIAKLAEEARYSMRLNGEDEGFKLNNTHRAPLARILVDEHPEVGKVMERRKSKTDRL